MLKFLIGLSGLIACLIIPIRAMAAEPSAPLPPGFIVFPGNNIWNTPVDKAPVHPQSAVWMSTINGHSGHPLHADFGSKLNGHFNGIPYNVARNTTPKVHVSFDPALNYAAESDPIPPEGLPIPADALVEGDPPPGNGDRHLLLVDVDNNVLHEMYGAVKRPDGSYTCTQYSRWDLNSNALRPEGWTSADAGGLPIFPGLVRWDEIQAGEIKHALRFTLELTWKPHLWPARHDAVSGTSLNPPMGMRVRLKANFDISGYSPTNQIILKALKKYGMFLTDNGGDWYISGAPNPNFDDNDLHLLSQIIPGAAFEVVDTHTWMVDPNSAAINKLPTPTLNLPPSVPVTSQISATYPPGYDITGYQWSFIPTPSNTMGQASSANNTGPASGIALRTPDATARLAPLSLSLGAYQISVAAIDGHNNISAPAVAHVTLVNSDLSSLRVFPNPWRSDRHSGIPVTFDGLAANSTVKIFTTSGHLARTLPPSASSITWDLTNDSGDKVASGIYLYLIQTPEGQTVHGQLTVIK